MSVLHVRYNGQMLSLNLKHPEKSNIKKINKSDDEEEYKCNIGEIMICRMWSYWSMDAVWWKVILEKKNKIKKKELKHESNDNKKM